MSSDIDTLITVLILAGGRGKRVGGEDKGLLIIAGQPLVSLVLGKFNDTYSKIIISANRNLDVYRRYGLPVQQDITPGFQGPLTGISSIIDQVTSPYMLVLPCDMPNLPTNIGHRLLQKLNDSDYHIAVVHDGQRLQPLCCLLSTSLGNSLRSYLSSGQRRVDQWILQQPHIIVDFSDEAAAFTNINNTTDITAFVDLTQ